MDTKYRVVTLQCRCLSSILFFQEEHDNANALAFWMANTSELLHFFKQDRNIGPYSIDSQDVLAEAVQVAFRELVMCLQNDLRQTMPAFLDDSDEDADEDWMMGTLVSVVVTGNIKKQLDHYVVLWGNLP
jgi:afadin